LFLSKETELFKKKRNRTELTQEDEAKKKKTKNSELWTATARRSLWISAWQFHPIRPESAQISPIQCESAWVSVSRGKKKKGCGTDAQAVASLHRTWVQQPFCHVRAS